MYGLCLTYDTTVRTDALFGHFVTVVLKYYSVLFFVGTTLKLPCSDVIVAPALHWDLPAMADYLQKIRASSKNMAKNQLQHSTDLQAKREERARLQLNHLSLEPRDNKVHSPIDIHRLNIRQVIVEAVSRIANLHHPTHQPWKYTLQANKHTNSPDPWARKPPTPSPSAQA
jgi:hypothetical protein